MIESTIQFDSKPVKYIPALGFGFLTPFFDSFQKWGMKETTFKLKLIEQAKVGKGAKVLDLGCGTGTLTILLKKSYPLADVKGIDIDSQVLAIAKQKAAQEKESINFDNGTVFDLPYPAQSFDRVVSSLVFHHLTRENKIRALKEVFRVLKTSGEVHVADIGKPQNLLMRLPSSIIRRTEEAEDNVRGLLPQMLEIAGFHNVKRTTELMTLFGTITLISGTKQ